MESEKRHFLTVADNVAFIRPEDASPDDLDTLVRLCLRGENWYRFEYDIAGVHIIIHPREIIETRKLSPEEQEVFINAKTQELGYADNVRLTLLDPDKPDFIKAY